MRSADFTDLATGARRWRSWSALRAQPLLWGSLLLLFGIGLIVWRLYVLTNRQISATALESTAVYARTLEAFREVYTSEVVNRLTASGVPVTHDYLRRPTAIPLPVTLTMALADRVNGKGDSGTTVRLFSDYPFPWRRADGGPRDAFERSALTELRAQPQRPFYRVEQEQGHPVLRYALADRMSAACVPCHNSHPESPRRDWKIGDVRGVLEVAVPLTGPMTLGLSHLREVVGLLLLLFVLAVGAVATSVLRLARARALAEQVSEERALFTSELAHEIRTPMNGFLGLADLLRYTALSDKQRAYVEAMRTTALALRALVNRVLDADVRRIGQEQRSADTFDLHLLLEEATLVQMGASGGGEVCLRRTSDTPRWVRGDLTRLLQVLLNLLANGQHHGGGGDLQVSVLSHQGTAIGDQVSVEFAVQDSGPGLSREEQARLFQPRGSPRRPRVELSQGAGLGLAICKQLVLEMGGELGVTTVEGSGARFWFVLSLQIAEPSPSAGQAPPGGPPALSRRFVGSRVLVIEDDQVSQDVLVGMLTELGATVTVASSGSGALGLHQQASLAPAQGFDLILLDGHMPGLGGPETARALRLQSDGAATPIIAVTADTGARFESEARRSGFVDFLNKPYTLDQLTTLLVRWLPGVPAPRRSEATVPSAIVAQFLLTAPRDLAQLCEAALQQDAQRLADAAHTLAGSASFVRAAGLVTLCRTLEVKVGAPDWAALSSLCAAAVVEWQRVRVALDSDALTGGA